MATKKKASAPVAVESLVETGATSQPANGAEAPRRRGRPKGSKNRPKDVLSLKRGPGRPRAGANGLESELGHRIDAMINELYVIRAEVAKLEQLRSVLRELQGM